jgi:hypothetical protein
MYYLASLMYFSFLVFLILPVEAFVHDLSAVKDSSPPVPEDRVAQ